MPRVPEIKERLAFIAILILPILPRGEEQGGRVGGEEGCEVTRGRGRGGTLWFKSKSNERFFLFVEGGS